VRHTRARRAARGALLVALTGLTLLAAVCAAPAGAAPAGGGPSAAPAGTVAHPGSRLTARAARATAKTRWIAVSVATLWVEPRQARPVDAPSLAVPADPRAWVAGMSVADKHRLVGRLETQALLGDKVQVLATSGAWSKVAVAAQPTPRDARGYPGWLPTAQLTAKAPVPTAGVATVTRPTAWLYKSSDLHTRVLEVSYATRLYVQSSGDAWVEVATPAGEHLFAARGAVDLRARGSRPAPPTGAQVVAEARRFLGLQYLWAGTSGFGFDCSGFSSSVFRVLGVTIPRDAGPQSTFGRAVRSLSALRAGDLVFFRNAEGDLHHVGICVGGGRMIHSPATGKPVAEVSLSGEPYTSEFAGGRRLTR
jgi:gamma-D-glutamyl-L-lysine dipeptidyl-peptidase